MMRWHRLHELRKQRMKQIEVQGLSHLAAAVAADKGVLIAPNHSFHWDSYCLFEATHRLRLAFYTMTAWQVFAQSSWVERMSLQHCGCFSINREGTDLQALKTAVDILRYRRQPLVIFPEGDIYHTNDRVTPLREGAASIALMAARKSTRPMVILPTAIKRWYVRDPTPSLLKTIRTLEQYLLWRPRTDLPLLDRVRQVGHGLLGLKELEHLGEVRGGDLPGRIRGLAGHLLERMEARYGLKSTGSDTPDRVKNLRRHIIAMRRESANQISDLPTVQACEAMDKDMDNLFFVTQLYSYPVNYLGEHPTRERLAETLDKLEEDALGAVYPSVRGDKRVVVRFGEPIEVSTSDSRALSSTTLTIRLERAIQGLLDELNAANPR